MSDKGGKKNDINVTPLVDVVFTLLIVILVTLPVLMRHISLKVPRELEDNEVVAEDTGDAITVCGKTDGNIIVTKGLSEQTVKRAQLAQTVAPMLENKRTEKIVFVGFEDQVPYGDAIGIMDTLKQVKADKVALKKRDDPRRSCAAQ